MIILFFLYNIVFLVFLYYIWFYYGMLIPAGFFMFILLFTSWSKGKDWFDIKKFFKVVILDNLLYISWFLIVGGIFFLSTYASQYYMWGSVDEKQILLYITMVNVILCFVSVLANYKEWLKITYLTSVILICFFTYWIDYLDQIKYVLAFLLWFNSWLNAIHVAKFGKIREFGKYATFFLVLTIYFWIVYDYIIWNFLIIGLLIQLVSLIFLIAIVICKNLLDKINEKDKQEENKEKEKKVFWYSDIIIQTPPYIEKVMPYRRHIEVFFDFFDKSPWWVKIWISLFNTWPIVAESYLFVKYINEYWNLANEIYYWLWSIIFVINFFLLKYLNWYYYIQRMFAFFIINFIAYVTIIDVFLWKTILLVTWWVTWNLFSTILMFAFSITTFWKKILSKSDYFIWNFINIIWLTVNSYFIYRIWFDVYLTAWILLLYIWLYTLIFRLMIAYRVKMHQPQQSNAAIKAEKQKGFN